MFGSKRDIYNPWSITSFLKRKKLATYWASTSSNGLISRILRTSGSDVKMDFETLMSEGVIVKQLDEQIVFSQINVRSDAIWSLMLAGGYLRIYMLNRYIIMGLCLMARMCLSNARVCN